MAKVVSKAANIYNTILFCCISHLLTLASPSHISPASPKITSISHHQTTSPTMQLTTTTLLALALSISTSATSISTFRTEIMPSPTMSQSASRIDTSTPLIDSSTNFTVPQRGTGGPARPESLCHGISPMCYAIAHGKRDCYEAWMVCFFFLLLPLPFFFIFFPLLLSAPLCSFPFSS